MIDGIGIDIVEIRRIENSLMKWGDHFINKVFTPEEISYSKKHKHSAQHFAGRFAAKEAVFKAISNNPKLGWQDIQIFNDDNGKPYCRVSNLDDSLSIGLSISHSKDYAVANAIITKKS